MPPPNSRDRLDPEDLAKRIAERLAESGESNERGSFSWRNSVLIGRLMSGVLIAAVAGALVFGVTMGVNWFMGRSAAAVGDVDPIYPDSDEGSVEPAVTGSTVAARVEGLFFLASTTTTTLAGPFAPTTISVGISRVPLPATTTTTTAPSTSTTSQSTTASSAVVPTTQPPGTTVPTSPPTTIGPTTTSSTTSQVTTTTIPSTTTTQASTTSTTQASTTTSTTTTSTTTTAATTTSTTCGNNGNGNGNC